MQDLQSSHENSFSSYFSLKIFKERRELSIKDDESETIAFQQQKITILFSMSLSLRGSFYKDDFESLIMPEKIDLASKSLKVDLGSKSFF